MTAEPIEGGEYVSWQPDRVRQRLADYTIEDVLNLPPDAPRVELSDGVIQVVPSPTEDHQDISSLLWSWFRTNAPKEFKAVQGPGVAVEVNRTYEPDVLLRKADDNGGRHFILAEQAVIVVEVVSPGTRARDRFAKPAEYAAAGIPYYWRVEQNPVHIYAYRLGADGTYEPAADSADVLKLIDPFPIDLPVSEITP